MFKHMAALTVGCITMISMSGCYSPGGGLFAHAGGSTTYYSTERLQKTVSLVDTRSNETLFSIDLAPGQQLTIDFDKGEGDDPTNRPDLMRYEVMEKGTKFGTLEEAMSVPNSASRRVDVSFRQSAEYAAEAQQARLLRTDELADRPNWWTAQGGPMPQDERLGMYDN